LARPSLTQPDSFTIAASSVELWDDGSSTSSIVLDSLNVTVFSVDSTLAFYLCPTCPVDLRGNSGTVPVITAGVSVCILGQVLLDSGVGLTSVISAPDVFVTQDRSSYLAHCGLPTGVSDGFAGPRMSESSLGLRTVNPAWSSRGLRLLLHVPQGGADAMLLLIDAAGRTVARRALGNVSAGDRWVTWQLRGEELLRAGVYEAVAIANGARASTTVILLR
jgi:hypothetical protein